MPIAQTLIDEVGTLFRSHWSERNGQNVPEAADVQLTNDAVKLDGTVLYADLADSTKMVDAYPSAFSAEFYKAFLSCAARIIRDEGGAITAYDGDRVMAVFIGDSKNTRAARTALKISWAMTSVVQPALRQQYPSIAFTPRHVVGVDTSPLFIARTGVRGANDLVWVGRAANHAAKMAALPRNTLDIYFRRRLRQTSHQRENHSR